MKRTALTLILILGISGVFAQSAKVVSAYNYMKPQYNELDKAKESIDQAAQHPKTSMEAKTWYYRGQVYYKLFQSTDEKFANLDDNPLLVAYKSFVKATFGPICTLSSMLMPSHIETPHFTVT